MTDLHKDLALASQADAIIASLPTLSSLASTKGKNKSDLSFMSTIKCPQLWPNNFVTRLDASRPAYGDLDMAQFVCGYLDCIRQSPIQLQPLMFDHLYTLMDLTTRFQWSAVWAFHGRILCALEQGSVSWQSDFSRFQVGLFLPSQELPVHASKSCPTKAADRDSPCHAWNFSSCQLLCPQNHSHICLVCKEGDHKAIDCSKHHCSASCTWPHHP